MDPTMPLGDAFWPDPAPGAAPVRLDELSSWLAEADARLAALAGVNAAQEQQLGSLQAGLTDLTRRVGLLEAIPTPTPTPTPIPTPTPTPIPTPTPTPTPVPAGAKNVRDFGAKGDGVTNDTPAIQALLGQMSLPGDVYFPPGVYKLATPLELRRSGQRVWGDGAASVLDHGGWNAFTVYANLTGLSITRVKMVGFPGRYAADGNTVSRGVECVQKTQLLIDDCDFAGPAYAYSSGESGAFDPANRWPVVLRNCRVHGWGVVGVGVLRGGERIENCSFIQDDPSITGQRSSHGLYITGGATDVVVTDTLIQNARKLALQVWNQYQGRTINHIQFSRCTFKDCLFGPIISKDGDPLVGQITNVLFEDCLVSGILSGGGLRLNCGSGITLRRNAIERAPVGVLFDQPNPAIANVIVEQNTIKDCPVGIRASRTAGYSNVRLGPNSFVNCPLPYDAAGISGITIL